AKSVAIGETLIQERMQSLVDAWMTLPDAVRSSIVDWLNALQTSPAWAKLSEDEQWIVDELVYWLTLLELPLERHAGLNESWARLKIARATAQALRAHAIEAQRILNDETRHLGDGVAPSAIIASFCRRILAIDIRTLVPKGASPVEALAVRR